jgi:hypothetical protein
MIEMIGLSNKDLLEIYDILKKFVKSLEERKGEEEQND